MRSIRVALACVIAILLAGCAGTRLPASVSGGIDRIFPEPPHEIKGATPVDQGWIDETIEAGSTCCGWIVKPRPLGLDPTPVPVAVSPLVKAPAPSRVTTKPKKKPLWLRMLKGR